MQGTLEQTQIEYIDRAVAVHIGGVKFCLREASDCKHILLECDDVRNRCAAVAVDVTLDRLGLCRGLSRGFGRRLGGGLGCRLSGGFCGRLLNPLYNRVNRGINISCPRIWQRIINVPRSVPVELFAGTFSLDPVCF